MACGLGPLWRESSKESLIISCFQIVDVFNDSSDTLHGVGLFKFGEQKRKTEHNKKGIS